MKKFLTFVILGLFYLTPVYSFINFKPLSELELKINNDVEIFFQSIEDRSDKCEMKLWHNEVYHSEIINYTISEYDFYEISRLKGKEINLNCEDLIYEISDINNQIVKQKYQLSADICGGKIYAYNVVFHLAYNPGLMNSRPGFGADPDILKEWVNYFKKFSKNEVVKKKEKEREPYKDLDGKLYDSYMDMRDWKHQILDSKGKIAYQIFLSSTIYGNEKLGPTMNRISFSMHENTISRIKACNKF